MGTFPKKSSPNVISSFVDAGRGITISASAVTVSGLAIVVALFFNQRNRSEAFLLFIAMPNSCVERAVDAMATDVYSSMAGVAENNGEATGIFCTPCTPRYTCSPASVLPFVVFSKSVVFSYPFTGPGINTATVSPDAKLLVMSDRVITFVDIRILVMGSVVIIPLESRFLISPFPKNTEVSMLDNMVDE